MYNSVSNVLYNIVRRIITIAITDAIIGLNSYQEDKEYIFNHYNRVIEQA